MSRAPLGPIERLRTEARRFANLPYLVTVTDTGRPHCAISVVDWETHGDELRAPAPSGWAASEAHGHRHVTLLWPPEAPGGYSLIVDGVASSLGKGATRIAVTPTRAVLHRRRLSRTPKPGGQSDCISILPD